MKPAPLYVDARDLARDVVMRAQVWKAAPLADLATRAAADLLVHIATALSFRDGRAEALLGADRAVVRLRETLRLTGDAGVLSAGGLRSLCSRLDGIGRQIGGWRAHVAHARDPP